MLLRFTEQCRVDNSLIAYWPGHWVYNLRKIARSRSAYFHFRNSISLLSNLCKVEFVKSSKEVYSALCTSSHPHDIIAIPTYNISDDGVQLLHGVCSCSRTFQMPAGKWAIWYANSMQLTLFFSRFLSVCNLPRTFNRFIFRQCCQHSFYFDSGSFCAMWSPLFILTAALFRLNNCLWKWIFFYYFHPHSHHSSPSSLLRISRRNQENERGT